MRRKVRKVEEKNKTEVAVLKSTAKFVLKENNILFLAFTT